MHVKPLDQITSKWSQRAGQAGPAYTLGVNNPKNPWAAATQAAKDSWAQGVQNAVTNNRFQAGVAKAGDQKWSQGATTKGVANYPTGVQRPQSQTNFSQGFGKYASVLSALNLGPKFPKGSQQNQQRSIAVQVALHAAKVGK